MAEDVERLLTPDEVAERLGISMSTARAWMRTGQLPSLKLGDRGLLRCREADLNAFIRELAEIGEAERSERASRAARVAPASAWTAPHTQTVATEAEADEGEEELREDEREGAFQEPVLQGLAGYPLLPSAYKGNPALVEQAQRYAAEKTGETIVKVALMPKGWRGSAVYAFTPDERTFALETRKGAPVWIVSSITWARATENAMAVAGEAAERD